MYHGTTEEALRVWEINKSFSRCNFLAVLWHGTSRVEIPWSRWIPDLPVCGLLRWWSACLKCVLTQLASAVYSVLFALDYTLANLYIGITDFFLAPPQRAPPRDTENFLLWNIYWIRFYCRIGVGGTLYSRAVNYFLLRIWDLFSFYFTSNTKCGK